MNRNDCMSIRIEAKLKKDFETFCAKSGMTVSGASNLLIKKTIKEGKIPFQVSSQNEVKDVNNGGKPQVLRTAIRIDREAREDFSKVCNEIGIPMSRIIKMFMLQCINTGKLPF